MKSSTDQSRAIVGLILGVLLAYLLQVQLASSQEAVLRGTRLELVDQADQLRCHLSTQDNGTTQLTLIDQKDRNRLVLSVPPEGMPSITFVSHKEGVIKLPARPRKIQEIGFLEEKADDVHVTEAEMADLWAAVQELQDRVALLIQDNNEPR